MYVYIYICMYIYIYVYMYMHTFVYVLLVIIMMIIVIAIVVITITNLGRVSFRGTKSGGGERFPPLDCRAKAPTKGVFFCFFSSYYYDYFLISLF